MTFPNQSINNVILTPAGVIRKQFSVFLTFGPILHCFWATTILCSERNPLSWKGCLGDHSTLDQNLTKKCRKNFLVLFLQLMSCFARSTRACNMCEKSANYLSWQKTYFSVIHSWNKHYWMVRSNFPWHSKTEFTYRTKIYITRINTLREGLFTIQGECVRWLKTLLRDLDLL